MLPIWAEKDEPKADVIPAIAAMIWSAWGIGGAIDEDDDDDDDDDDVLGPWSMVHAGAGLSDLCFLAGFTGEFL